MYLPGTSNEDPGGVRWFAIQKKKSVDSCSTQPHTLCQLPGQNNGIWLTSLIQYLPDGWTNEGGHLCPVRALLKPALDAVIELIKLQMSEI